MCVYAMRFDETDMELIFRGGDTSALWKKPDVYVYLLHGDEDCLKEEAEKALVEHFVQPDFQDFDFEVLNAESVSADSILSAAGQVPFGSERRVVVVKGMEQWRDRGRQSEADRLAEGLGRLTDATCLILVVGAQEDEARRKIAVTPRLDAGVKKFGRMIVCRGLTEEAGANWIQNRVKQMGKRISADASEALIQSVGTEMRLLENEILKLIFYTGERTQIEKTDVNAIVAAQSEDVVFETVEAITRQQTDRALLLLSELHRHDPKPQAVAGKLLALLARQYRMLWQAKHLAAMRVQPRDLKSLPEHLTAELPGESSITQIAFKAGDLFTLSNRYTWPDLQRALDSLLRCDLANKGGATEEEGLYGSDPTANLQLLVIELTL